MTRRSAYVLLLTASVLAACGTTTAALDGVGGVFSGASDDVRSLSRR